MSVDKELYQKLSGALGNKEKIIIIGVGNALNGDDALGPWISEELNKIKSDKDVAILDGETVPENSINKIIAIHPKIVVFIDCADFGGEPGDIKFIREDEISELSLSTHSMPLSFLTGYLRKEYGIESVIIGIQGEHFELGTEMGPVVRKAGEKLIRVLTEILLIPP
jgi:hydrogenase 3 maturation protease